MHSCRARTKEILHYKRQRSNRLLLRLEKSFRQSEFYVSLLLYYSTPSAAARNKSHHRSIYTQQCFRLLWNGAASDTLVAMDGLK
jgi:hypothetical protein